MRHQIATNPSQSKCLLACGVDPNTADMYLSINMCPGENYGKYSTRVLGEDLITLPKILRSIDYSPAWSLPALLALLPKGIQYEGLQTNIKVEQCSRSGWSVSYYDYYMDDIAHEVRGFGIIESCVIMIEWLTANGYYLNTK